MYDTDYGRVVCSYIQTDRQLVHRHATAASNGSEHNFIFLGLIKKRFLIYKVMFVILKVCADKCK